MGWWVGAKGSATSSTLQEAILQTLVAPWFLGRDSRSIVQSMEDWRSGYFSALAAQNPADLRFVRDRHSAVDLAAKRAGHSFIQMWLAPIEALRQSAATVGDF